MKKYSALLVALSIVLASATSCGLFGKKGASHDNQTLPELTLTSADGRQVQLSSMKGKMVFVNLWATWCPPCVAEMPSIQQLYSNTAASKPEFVLISFDKDFKTATSWIKRKGMDLPIYTVEGDLPELFNVNGIPTTFIFDKEGNLIFQKTGSENYNHPKFVGMLSGK